VGVKRVIKVEELIYPDDTPLADEDVSEDATEVDLFSPTGETIPVRLFLPEITDPRMPIIIQFSTDDEQLERQMLDEAEALYST
jgi:hypothetical protein